MKKNALVGILMQSESLKKTGTSREGDQAESASHHSPSKSLGKGLLKKGKKN